MAHIRINKRLSIPRSELEFQAVERFAELIADALRPRKKRKKTRPSRASNERRLETKKRRGRKKKLRKKIRPPKDY